MATCCSTLSGLTCVVAQALPLLSSPVEPDAEAHEDDPAGPSDAGDESRLLHHVGDLLRDAVVPVAAHNHVPEVLAYMCAKRMAASVNLRVCSERNTTLRHV